MRCSSSWWPSKTVSDRKVTKARTSIEIIRVPRALRTMAAVLRQATAPAGPRPKSHGMRRPRVWRVTWPEAAPPPRRRRRRRSATLAEVSRDSSRKSTGRRAVSSNRSHHRPMLAASQGRNSPQVWALIVRAQGSKGRVRVATTGWEASSRKPCLGTIQATARPNSLSEPIARTISPPPTSRARGRAMPRRIFMRW